MVSSLSCIFLKDSELTSSISFTTDDLHDSRERKSCDVLPPFSCHSQASQSLQHSRFIPFMHFESPALGLIHALSPRRKKDVNCSFVINMYLDGALDHSSSEGVSSQDIPCKSTTHHMLPTCPFNLARSHLLQRDPRNLLLACPSSCASQTPTFAY